MDAYPAVHTCAVHCVDRAMQKKTICHMITHRGRDHPSAGMLHMIAPTFSLGNSCTIFITVRSTVVDTYSFKHPVVEAAYESGSNG